MDVIHIVGAGGIGCAVGYALRMAGLAVNMVETNPVKIENGRRDGLRLNDRPAVTAAFTPFEQWQPGSVVLLCTKCYDNAAVLRRLPTGVTLIPIQNGFDPALEATEHLLEGIASFVSECPADRPHPRITRRGHLHLGPRLHSNEPSPLLDEIVQAFRQAALFKVVQVPAIEPYKYTKLLYNAAISPLAAAAGIDNGQLLAHPLARRLFFAMLQENYRILAEAGIELGKIGPFHPATVAGILKRRWLARLLARAFEPSLRGTYCSMAPDLPRGKTEIDNYNQRLVEIAGDRPCPLNRAAVALIKRMEHQHEVPSLHQLDDMQRLLDL